jgi:hypothetical protein
MGVALSAASGFAPFAFGVSTGGSDSVLVDSAMYPDSIAVRLDRL